MSSATRILLAASEVAPFTESKLSQFVHNLPSHITAESDWDVRIMAPRYGSIDEHRNGLHEVIRLSGTKIPMGETIQELKVKVARVPDSNLQVYFMDHAGYYDRSGIYGDGDALFEDNMERALFFARSVLTTLRKLRWGPDVLHAVGGMSAFIPFLLRSEEINNELLSDTTVFFTPGSDGASLRVNHDQARALQVSLDASLSDEPFDKAGARHADLTLLPPHATDGFANAERLDQPGEQLAALYERTLHETPA